MAQVSDPCPQWAVFRMIDDRQAPERGSQISVLRDGDQSLLYCCHSRRVADMAGNAHVLSVGVDLAPALLAHGTDPVQVVDQIGRACLGHRGIAPIPAAPARSIGAIAKVLNIAWIEDALKVPARIICPRSSRCPLPDPCDGAQASRAREITDVRDEILGRARRCKKESLPG
jgi:hypothetical protein